MRSQHITAPPARLTEHHRFLLRGLLNQVNQLNGRIERPSERIDKVLPSGYRDARTRLATIPGFGERVTECVLAEVGADMSVFPTAAHLASWAEMCPGQRQSAGKHGSGSTRHGNTRLRPVLVQAAWAASHTKNTYLSAQFHRLVGRRGKKRALVAVSHTQLVIAYHLLKSGTEYRELGSDYFDRLDAERATRKLVHRLEQLLSRR